jgi:tetratricopeptide (TPR) repeat protein
MLAMGAVMGSLTSHLEKVQVGAVGKDFDLGFAERTLVAGRAVWFYLEKLVWPHPLAFNYARWTPDPGDVAQWAYPAAAAACFASLWFLRGRIGRAPVAAAAFFGVSLAPALGYFDVFPMKYSFVADHFQYLASIGPIALASAGGVLGWRRLSLPRAAGRPAAAALLAALGVLTWNQAGAYEDLETLWRRTLAVEPDAFMARYNLGKLLQARGDVAGAMEQYREALRAKPDLAPALVNVANHLAETGQTEAAIEHYVRALRADPAQPLAHYNLGLLLQESGRLGEAEAAYREAARLDPTLGAAVNNLAILLYRRGAYAEAWAQVREARRRGTNPHPEFLRALSAAMPEPR